MSGESRSAQDIYNSLKRAAQREEEQKSASSSTAGRNDPWRHFREIMQQRAKKRQEELEAQHPSFKVIPTFFRKSSKHVEDLLEESEQTEGMDPTVTVYPMKQLAHQKLIEKKTQELPDERDLQDIVRLLTEVSNSEEYESDEAKKQTTYNKEELDFINYDQFCRVRDRCSAKAKRYFAPSVFLKFARDSRHRINAQVFFQYVFARLSVEQIRVHLSTYDSTTDDHLREEDLECYIDDLIPVIRGLEKLDESFHQYYIFTAVRKFMFCLDSKNRGKIPVNEVACSRVMAELCELRKDLEPVNDEPLVYSDQSEPSGWFSANGALAVYTAYAELDKDGDGLLTADELSKYGMGTLTKCFVERVFQEYHTFEGYMDYKGYLDFVLAMELRRSEASVRYIFHVLDTGHKGYLTLDEMTYYFKEVTKVIQSFGQDPPYVKDVITELLDMTKPATPGIITFQDLQRCRLGHIVLHVLTDVQGFWQYDNREHAGMTPQSPAHDELG
eukprot:gb/GECG01002814.1/.p1 GENE.gb/GECG01002814.1/~~gb/GECG01002814.1/.p1  ORF type:complete len:500 (+),score=72.87 gb/GECG01002814.1/:1-1500(+)